MFVALRGDPFLLQKRRDKTAAQRSFQRVLRCFPIPRKIVIDQLRSYPAAKADFPELTNVRHALAKTSARVNNRAENSNEPTRGHVPCMRGFRAREHMQALLSSFGPIRQPFAQSQTAHHALPDMARIHQSRPKSIQRTLSQLSLHPRFYSTRQRGNAWRIDEI